MKWWTRLFSTLLKTAAVPLRPNASEPRRKLEAAASEDASLWTDSLFSAPRRIETVKQNGVGSATPRTNEQTIEPSLAEMERIADIAFANLPEAFRKLCDDVVIEVDDFPEDEILRKMNCKTKYGLLGLFSGVGHIRGSRYDVSGFGGAQMPNRIYLYRGPILSYCARTGNPLEDVVNHVLVHEIGHHLGFSDADMEEIENEPN